MIAELRFLKGTWDFGNYKLQYRYVNGVVWFDVKTSLGASGNFEESYGKYTLEQCYRIKTALEMLIELRYEPEYNKEKLTRLNKHIDFWNQES